MMSTSAVHKQAADTSPAADGAAQSPSTLHTSSSTENNGISSSNSDDAPTSSVTRKCPVAPPSIIVGAGADSSTSSSSLSGVSSSSGNGNNPFCRVTPPASYHHSPSSSSDSAGGGNPSGAAAAASSSTSSSSSRSILAPSKLGGFGSSSSSVLSSSVSSGSFGAVRGVSTSGNVLAPSRLFVGGGASSSPFGRIPEQHSPPSSGTKFKLKPSILGSSVKNPFLKPVAGEFDLPDSCKSSDNRTPDGASSESLSSCTSSSTSSITNTSSSSSSSSTTAKTTTTTTEDSVGSSSEATSNNKQRSKEKGADTSFTATPPPSPPHSTDSSKPTGASNSSSTTKPSSSSSSSSSGAFVGAFAPRSSEVKGSAASSSPLVSNGVKPATLQPSTFVFGQNLESRVVDGVASSSKDSSNPCLTTSSSDNLFSAAASEYASASSSSSLQAVNGNKSLETSSREIAEKEAREKRKFDEVEVITGEETESNVLQMDCKMYTWDKGAWHERGRGILRLNDWGSGGVEMHSRLVIRTKGTLTVMLNTKIWGEMTVEQASSKGVRFTAIDADGQLKVYLVMGGAKDVELLYASLECRVSNSRKREQSTASVSSPSASKKIRAD